MHQSLAHDRYVWYLRNRCNALCRVQGSHLKTERVSSQRVKKQNGMVVAKDKIIFINLKCAVNNMNKYKKAHMHTSQYFYIFICHCSLHHFCINHLKQKSARPFGP